MLCLHVYDYRYALYVVCSLLCMLLHLRFVQDIMLFFSLCILIVHR